MTDLLEKAIRENHDAFDDEAPQGHFERFEKKLDKGIDHQRKFKKQLFWQIAAVLVIALLLGNQVRLSMAPKTISSPTLASVSPEYGEVEFYYTSAIDQSMARWTKLTKEGYISGADQKMMQQELAEFDRIHKQLQKDLKSTPGDERVINAMLEYYQARLHVIQLVVDKLQKAKQQKLTNNETEI